MAGNEEMPHSGKDVFCTIWIFSTLPPPAVSSGYACGGKVSTWHGNSMLLPEIEKLQWIIPWKGYSGTLWRVFSFATLFQESWNAAEQPCSASWLHSLTEPGLLILLLRENKAVLCVSERGEITPPVAFAIYSPHPVSHPLGGFVLVLVPTESVLSVAKVASGGQASQSVCGDRRTSKIRSAGMVDWRFMRDLRKENECPCSQLTQSFPTLFRFHTLFLYLTAKTLLTYFSP